MPKRSLKIVLLMIEPPLPFGNAASRWYYVLLKTLTQRGHRVKCFCACSNPDDISKTKEFFPDSKYDINYYLFPQKRGFFSKFKTILHPQSFQFSRELKNGIKQAMKEDVDILHVEQLWAGWVALKYANKALINLHYLLSIDLSLVKPETLKQKVHHALIFRTEKKMVRSFPTLRSCSPRLVPILQRWNPNAFISTVPFGLDMKLYDFIPDEERSDQKTISLIGNMNWHPSQSAAYRLLDKLWPKIHKAVPDARLQIVGWSARSVLKKYLDLKNVEIHENVADIKPYFKNSNVMLYTPSRGSGMKIKILESMAFGIPVVTTSEGVESLPAIDQVHAGISESDEQLISRTIHLLNSIDLQNQYRKKARELVESHCHPEKTVNDIEYLYTKILKKRPGNSRP